MAVAEFHTSSRNALFAMQSFIAIVPEGAPGPWPVLYLLHGLSDDHTAWTRRTCLERYVESLPLLVVMPNGGRGWYTDAAANPKGKYETYLTQDLIGFVDSTFPTRAERSGRVVAGLSMGGYGAVKLALKHPDLYSAALSFSGAMAAASRPFDQAGDWRTELSAIFGDNPKGGADDVFALFEGADRTTLPEIRLDCGLDDHLVDSNRKLAEHLKQLGIAHDYQEHPGGHDWEYWQRGILRHLPWLKEHFEIAVEVIWPEA